MCCEWRVYTIQKGKIVGPLSRLGQRNVNYLGLHLYKINLEPKTAHKDIVKIKTKIKRSEIFMLGYKYLRDLCFFAYHNHNVF